MDSTRIINLIANFDLTDFNIDIQPYFDNLNFEPLIEGKTFHNNFTNESRCYDNLGNLVYIGKVIDGQRNGFGVEYFKKFQKVKYRGFFKNDKIRTNKVVKILNENDQIIYFGHFNNGEPERGFIYDEKRGHIKIAGSFKNYLLHGETNYVFNEDGAILYSGKFCNGFPDNTDFRIYYKNGHYLYSGKGDTGVFYYPFSGKKIMDKEFYDESDWMILYDEHVHKEFDEFSQLDSITDDTYENLFIIENYEFFIMNEIKISDMIRVKNDIDINYQNLNRYIENDELYYRIVNQTLNFSLRYNPKRKKFKIVLYFNSKPIFDGYQEEGYQNDGFLNYADTQKNGNQIIVILADDLPIENPQIQYNKLIYDGDVEEIKVVLKYRRKLSTEQGENSFQSCGFYPKIETLSGFFDISWTKNFNQNYLGYIKNFKRHGYGILFQNGFEIETIWNNNLLNDIAKIKDKETLVFFGKVKNQEVNSIAYEKDMLKLDKCYGFVKLYDKSGKLRSKGEIRNNDRNFGIIYGNKGQIMYSGGSENDLYCGYGVEMYENQYPGHVIKRLGNFVNGELNGQGINNDNPNEKVGNFRNGQIINNTD